ncbi:hypothetical protein ACN20G_14390 [Streptomyces sp. BI20]|uniref:hypothetical protein n=1 Tax=Streptomyces sp. BI20 TaxID=3403460 RepID=UPI003C735630
MKAEELFFLKLTPDQRAELDAGFAQILADKEARAIKDHLPGLLTACVEKATERERMNGRTDHPARASIGSNPAVQGPVRRVRKGRSAARRAYDRVASFAGPVFISVVSGSIGLFLGATLVMRR